MGDVNSRIVSKDLMLTLRPRVCCSDSGGICDENSFCSSNPAKWRTIANDKQVRLAYPQDRKSIPGVVDFCFSYTDWYSKNGCGTLVKDIQDIIATVPACRIFSDKDMLVQSLLECKPDSQPSTSQLASSKESVAASETPAFVAASGFETQREPTDEACRQALVNNQKVQLLINDRCKGMNGNDLQGIATFCQRVIASERKTSGWPKWAGGGGLAAAVIYIIRLIKHIREIDKKAEEDAKKAGAFTKAISTINDDVKGFLEGVRKFFGVTLIDLGRTLKYVLTLKWMGKNREEALRSIQTEESKPLDETGQFTPDGVPAFIREFEATRPFIRALAETEDNQEVEHSNQPRPDRNVVLTQLDGLVEDERYQEEGINFKELDVVTKHHMAALAIDIWYRKFSPKQQETLQEVDSTPFHGKLPQLVIRSFASTFLNSKQKIAEVKAGNRSWLGHLIKKVIKELEPDEVERQLMSDTHFSNYPEIAKYVSYLAIHMFMRLDIEQQIDLYDVTNEPRRGQLTVPFILLLREELINLEDIRLNSSIYNEIIEIAPELRHYDFEIVDARVRNLADAWNRLKEPIRKLFDNSPQAFVDHMGASLRIGADPRERTERAKEPWYYEPASKIHYENFDLSQVMELMAQENFQLRLYPGILRLRSIALIKDWKELPEKIEFGFREQDEKMELQKLEVSVSFVRAWPGTFAGIGVDERSPIKTPKKGPKDPKGGPGSSGAAAGGSGEVDSNGSGIVTGFEHVGDGPKDRAPPTESHSARQAQRRIVQGGMQTYKLRGSNVWLMPFAIQRFGAGMLRAPAAL